MNTEITSRFNFRHILPSLLIFLGSFIPVSAQMLHTDRISFANPSSDSTRITDILVAEINSYPDAAPQQRLLRLARLFDGVKYQAGTLEHVPEMLSVNLDAFDCTTLVETAAALALTASEKRASWRDFVYNLERIRYRGGRMTDYPSRLHYISEWSIDLRNRGIMREVTEDIAQAATDIKTLDYITSHRDQYPALADDETFARMKEAEIGYRSHRIPYIKAAHMRNAALREGDIIAFTTRTKGLDVSHVGIITFVGGKPFLYHASSRAGKVTTEPVSLADYLRKNRQISGFKIYRLLDN